MVVGETIENWKLKLTRHPREDYFCIDRSIDSMAVADGVTRDPMLYLPNTRTILGRTKFSLAYPKPSPASMAAVLFCDKFPEVLRDFNDKDEKAVRKAFEEANRKIGEWNRENIPNHDYLVNDLAGCVASAVVRHDGAITYGNITDCGMAIFDWQGERKFETESEEPPSLKTVGLDHIGWRNPEARKQFRQNYRNKPAMPLSFGVLTGEELAMDYVRTGTHEVKPGDRFFVYTDGVEEAIFSDEFAEAIRKSNFENMKRVCQKYVRTEGTLVYDFIL